MRRPGFYIAIGSFLAVSGCAAAILGPPPRLAANRTWNSSKLGYVFRIAYFTPQEEKDSRWEAKRLEMMEQVIICKSGKQITRRDVRWYEPTAESIAPCAAIVYTVECDEPTNVRIDNLKSDRIKLLSQPTEAPLERQCGQKDRSKRIVTPTPLKDGI